MMETVNAFLNDHCHIFAIFQIIVLYFYIQCWRFAKKKEIVLL